MLDIFHTIFKFRDKESPDKLGLYPENVHVNAMPERRYLWTSRVLVILVCLSIAFNMMLASTIYVLLPQRNAAPQLFKVNQNFSQLEQVQPMEINMPVGDLITELHINEYIMQRYQITADYDELMRRWGKGSAIYWYSASDVFADFDHQRLDQRLSGKRNKDHHSFQRVCKNGYPPGAGAEGDGYFREGKEPREKAGASCGGYRLLDHGGFRHGAVPAAGGRRP